MHILHQSALHNGISTLIRREVDVFLSVRLHKEVLYIAMEQKVSHASTARCGVGGGCLNETIFGQVHATTINGYNCLHVVWDTSFLCVCDRAADAARGISNSCHGCSILRAAAGSYQSVAHPVKRNQCSECAAHRESPL
jgi:hypothetical protein